MRFLPFSINEDSCEPAHFHSLVIVFECMEVDGVSGQMLDSLARPDRIDAHACFKNDLTHAYVYVYD